MPLSDEAREAVREAVAIVREDRFEKYVRSRMAKDEPKKDAPKDGPPPPPKNEKPNEPPAKRGLWWGEVFSGDET